jgi:hypothetical protein
MHDNISCTFRRLATDSVYNKVNQIHPRTTTVTVLDCTNCQYLNRKTDYFNEFVETGTNP